MDPFIDQRLVPHRPGGLQGCKNQQQQQQQPPHEIGRMSRGLPTAEDYFATSPVGYRRGAGEVLQIIVAAYTLTML
jgi:hypothetical protein